MHQRRRQNPMHVVFVERILAQVAKQVLCLGAVELTIPAETVTDRDSFAAGKGDCGQQNGRRNNQMAVRDLPLLRTWCDIRAAVVRSYSQFEHHVILCRRLSYRNGFKTPYCEQPWATSCGRDTRKRRWYGPVAQRQ